MNKSTCLTRRCVIPEENGNPPPAQQQPKRDIHFGGNIKVTGHLTMGAKTAISHVNARPGEVMTPTNILGSAGNNGPNSRVKICGNIEAGSMQSDVDQAFNVRYADNGDTATNSAAEFYRRVMKEGEDPLDFAAELKALAVQKGISDVQLLEQFIHGLQREDWKRKLKAKPSMTMDRAVNMVEAWSDL